MARPRALDSARLASTRLAQDPLRVARQEAEEQAHIAQRLEEDMEAPLGEVQ